MPNWCSCSISLPGETAAEARATLSEVLARYAFDQPQIPYMQGGRHFQPPPERVVRFDRIHPFPPAIDPRGRPVGVAVTDDGAVLVADDLTNAIWRVTPNDA